MHARPSILILSFSPIASDARVLKQVRLAMERGDVTTCGYGPVPEGVVEHLRIPDDASIYPLSPKLLVARLGGLALRRATAVREAARLLRGRSFDAIIANDLEAVPMAARLAGPGGFLADLHEFGPGQHSNDPGWVRHVRPLLMRIARRELTRAAAVTTVAPVIADEYRKISGRPVGVVVNATPSAALEPSAVSVPIKLVHSGVALRNRSLELTVEAAGRCGGTVTLDLYLMPNDPAYLRELQDLAVQAGNVRVLPPVPYTNLISTLNQYDVGVFMLPPRTRNYEWALPNKFFDFVQARLGVIIGPSSQMAPYVERLGIGVVAEDFSGSALAEVIGDLTPSQVERWKRQSHAAAGEMSMESAIGPWRSALDRMLETAASR